MSSRYISTKIKEEVVLKQNGKCANSPFKPALNLKGYLCLLWKYENGLFDESGYQIDHINEYSILSKKDNIDANHISNLQALCPNCHMLKTKRFMKQKKMFTSEEIDFGRALMDVDEKPKSKKRKIDN